MGKTFSIVSEIMKYYWRGQDQLKKMTSDRYFDYVCSGFSKNLQYKWSHNIRKKSD